MNTALVGGGFGRVLKPMAADLVAVFYRAQLEKVSCAAGAGALFAGQELAAARRRLSADGREDSWPHDVPAALAVRARARCGRSDSGGDHQFRGRR